jgi:1-deoxy-D-xylulose 5-phosphate reductoisomerase
MKLLIAGATGSVGKVILSQILLRPEITSIIALSRTPGPLSSPEDGVDTPKLRNIPIEDYGAFPESVRKKFEGADVCIW